MPKLIKIDRSTNHYNLNYYNFLNFVIVIFGFCECEGDDRANKRNCQIRFSNFYKTLWRVSFHRNMKIPVYRIGSLKNKFPLKKKSNFVLSKDTSSEDFEKFWVLEVLMEFWKILSFRGLDGILKFEILVLYTNFTKFSLLIVILLKKMY